MAKKKMTANQLHKALGKLIEAGHGRSQVCINKRTFTHPLEGDGCCFLDVEGVVPQRITIMDGDGFTETTKAGREVSRRCVVLIGNERK